MAAPSGFGKLETLPEPMTDFVFTVTPDAWLLLCALFTAAAVVGFLAWRRLRMRRKRD